jgi:outer membrane protein OmpA-like peptidoglycan-associated protein
MRKIFSPALVVLLVAGLTLTGCATKKYVQEQVDSAQQRSDAKIGEVQTSVEANQQKIGELEKKEAELSKKVDQLSATARDALNRANEAGKLAKGKFLYEVTLTDDEVKFGFDKYALSDEAKAALDSMASKVKQANKNVFIEVQGHTDSIGSESYNLKLGAKRAEKVYRYLASEQGIALSRMNYISYGEYKPIADNGTREGRAKNRRVTLVVLE